MGLDQVVAEVRQDGEKRAQAVLDEARADANKLRTEAREAADALVAARTAQAEKEAEQLRAQIASGAEFEARKAVLEAESDLRDQLRARLIDGFGNLDTDVRKGHLTKLLAKAKASVPSGKVWGAAADEATLKDQKDYAYAGSIDIAGGIVVESEDGTVRLDLSYETMLGDMWRDILRQEANLFS